jgi:hypothetical protein
MNPALARHSTLQMSELGQAKRGQDIIEPEVGADTPMDVGLPPFCVTLVDEAERSLKYFPRVG